MRKLRLESLRRSGFAVLTAIEQKNTEALLSYVGYNGLAFGVDKPQISREELRRQFARKVGAYCLFFSTECIARMNRFKGLEPDEFLSKWKISYTDWLDANESYSMFADLTDDGGIDWCAGDVFAETQTQMTNAPNEIELDFAFYKGRWLLVDTVAGVP